MIWKRVQELIDFGKVRKFDIYSHVTFLACTEPYWKSLLQLQIGRNLKLPSFVECRWIYACFQSPFKNESLLYGNAVYKEATQSLYVRGLKPWIICKWLNNFEKIEEVDSAWSRYGEKGILKSILKNYVESYEDICDVVQDCLNVPKKWNRIRFSLIRGLLSILSKPYLKHQVDNYKEVFITKL